MPITRWFRINSRHRQEKLIRSANKKNSVAKYLSVRYFDTLKEGVRYEKIPKAAERSLRCSHDFRNNQPGFWPE
jgi:hypothetical protein